MASDRASDGLNNEPRVSAVDTCVDICLEIIGNVMSNDEEQVNQYVQANGIIRQQLSQMLQTLAVQLDTAVSESQLWQKKCTMYKTLYTQELNRKRSEDSKDRPNFFTLQQLKSHVICTVFQLILSLS